MLTATAGEAVIAHRFIEFGPWRGPIEKRTNGSLVAMETGTAIAYALDKLQDRGRFFINPQEQVYMGQVVGESNREGDIVVNVTKTKKLSNMRSSGADEKVKLAPPIIFSLEEALEYIQGDEYVEVTPESIRPRKIFLHEHERKKLAKQK
jgi:GTP-binding protein